MHAIHLARDEWGRSIIVDIQPVEPSADPFRGLRVAEVHELLFAPLDRHERRLVSAARRLGSRDQRRMVCHHILMNRRKHLLAAKKRREERAVMLCRQDVVDHENRQVRRRCERLARAAQRAAEPDHEH